MKRTITNRSETFINIVFKKGGNMEFKEYDRFRDFENEDYYGWFLTITRIDKQLKIIFFKYDGENIERNFEENSLFANELVPQF